MNWLRIFVTTLCAISAVLGGCEYAKYGSDHTMCIYKGYGCNIINRGLNDKEIATVVKVHNEYRQKVARGQQKGQPMASNMKQLEWDDELATIVQRLVDQCRMEHDRNRRSHKYSYAGQNLYMSWSSSAASPNFTNAVKSWYDEVSKVDPKNVQQFRFNYNTGHYTQVVWADTESIGCGAATFRGGSGWYTHLIGCNYGPGGNYAGAKMYEIGQPCSGCEKDWICSKEYRGLCN